MTVPGEHENNDLTEYVVTRWYRAPEIMLSCPEYTTAIDVWVRACRLLCLRACVRACSAGQQASRLISSSHAPTQPSTHPSTSRWAASSARCSAGSRSSQVRPSPAIISHTDTHASVRPRPPPGLIPFPCPQQSHGHARIRPPTAPPARLIPSPPPPSNQTRAGNDYIHQLKLITKLVGTPSGDELAFVTNHKARRFMLNLPREAQGNLLANLRARYPDASQEALDLLSRMLVIDPGKRITVGEALESPYLASLHDPGTSPLFSAVPAAQG